MKFLRIVLLVFLFFAAQSAFAAKPKLMDLRHGDYEIITHKAKGKKPYPLLVVVPAKDYTITGELFEEIATAAASNGFFVVRFNWGFVTNKDEPSKDLSTEANDLKTVIDYFSQQKDVDSKKIFVVSKSFGSRVVMKQAYDKSQGVALLTPNCSAKEPFNKTYASLFKGKKPVHLVISKDDPYCDVNQIYKAMGSLDKKNVTVFTLFGDHHFITSGGKQDLNKTLAVESVVNWLLQQKH